eukprot:jgi/Mesvir1/14952/Mv14624-RA.1
MSNERILKSQARCDQLDLENRQLQDDVARLKEQLSRVASCSQCTLCQSHANPSDCPPQPSASSATSEREPSPAQQCGPLPAHAEETSRLNLVLDSVKLGIWDWNPKTETLIVNKHWERMLGYEEHELNVTSCSIWRKLMHPDDFKGTITNLREHLSGASPVFCAEHRMAHKDGGWVWVLNTGKVVEWDAEGKPLRATGIHQDISVRKKLEEELTTALVASQSANRAKSAFLANMSHEIRTPMAGILGAGALLLDTPLGREQRELAGMMVDSTQLLLSIVNDILDLSKIEEGFLSVEAVPTDLDELLVHVHKLFEPKAREKGIEMKVNAVSQSEAHRWFMSDPTRLRQILLNLVGNAIKFTHTGSVTINADLSVHVHDASESLGRDRQRTPGTEPSREARTSADLTREARTSTDLTTEARTSADLTREARTSTDLTTEASGVAGSRGARRSEDSVRQGDGGVVVTDDGHEEWDLTIDIRDTGIGMSAYMVDHVFDRFQQADSSAARIYGGSGLGTTISKELAKRMGGDVTVESEEGKGSTFTLRLPVLRAAGDQPPPSPDVYSPRTVPAGAMWAPGQASQRACLGKASRQYGLTAILAEDNHLNRCILEKLLRTVGIQVVPACNGQAALDLVQNGAGHDLIFMDIQMPVCDGVTATKALRARGYERPIIALTANVMECDLQTYLSAGMQSTLPKPYSRGRICEEIDRLLRDGALPARVPGGVPGAASVDTVGESSPPTAANFATANTSTTSYPGPASFPATASYPDTASCHDVRSAVRNVLVSVTAGANSGIAVSVAGIDGVPAGKASTAATRCDSDTSTTCDLKSCVVARPSSGRDRSRSPQRARKLRRCDAGPLEDPPGSPPGQRVTSADSLTSLLRPM